MTWYTTQEEFRQAIEQGDEYLSGHGIDQNRRTHVRHLLEALYAEYREAFGSVPFRISWRKQIRKVFVLLRLKGASREDILAMPKGRVLLKVLRKIRWI